MKNVFEMPTTELGHTWLFVSRVGIGALPMGPNQIKLSPEAGGKIISYALSRGINFIDTAQCYDTYEHVRRGLETAEAMGCDVSDVVVCSKCLKSGYDEMADAIDEAIEKLGRESMDIFLMHELRSGQFRERSGAWQALLDAKSAGKVRAIGVSTHHADVTREMAEIPDCDVVFSLVNYAGLGIRTAMSEEEIAALDPSEARSIINRHGCLDKPGTADEMLEAIEKVHAAGKGVFIMKAFGGGNLTDSYRKSLDFITDHFDTIDSMMIGLTSLKEVDDICDYMAGDLAEAYNPDTSKKVVRVNQADCEGCGTCIKACASQAIAFNESGLAEINPELCLTCGYCAPVCPVRAIIMY